MLNASRPWGQAERISPIDLTYLRPLKIQSPQQMAVRMPASNRLPNGQFFSRKVIPADVRAAYATGAFLANLLRAQSLNSQANGCIARYAPRGSRELALEEEFYLFEELLYAGIVFQRNMILAG
jgi:hypothetical protein